MLNILKKKKINIISSGINYINKEKNVKIQNKLDSYEYKNIIFYPSSTKEWFNSIYSYNKSYTRPLVAINGMLNDLFISYFNMIQYKIKVLFKRRRHNKSRYSANKIYVSKAELKHTNKELFIILYTYNKQKSTVEQFIRKIVKLTNNKKMLVEEEIKVILTHRNRLLHILKNKFFNVRIWKMSFFQKIANLLTNLVFIVLNLKKNYVKFYKLPTYNIRMLKKIFRLQQLFFNSTKLINFNKSKFNNLVLNLSNIGLINFIQKIYDKKVKIKLVELKSIHLNSDLLSSAVTWKLRDRKNKAVRILRKAIVLMVKIPTLHTIITNDNNNQSLNLNNILNKVKGEISIKDCHLKSTEVEEPSILRCVSQSTLVEEPSIFRCVSESTLQVEGDLNNIKQQVVTGVRLEASGRLTRRLTAMRAIFKYRYVGSLKDIRSSFNNIPSTMLRGYVKSNSQYSLINYKTRNGSFGLKCWVSSHVFIPKVLVSFNLFIRKALFIIYKHFFFNYILSRLKKYELCYHIVIFVYSIYKNNLNKILLTYEGLFILFVVGLFMDDSSYYYYNLGLFYTVFIVNNYLKSNKEILANHPFIKDCFIVILDIMQAYYWGLLVYIVGNKLLSYLKKIWDSILNMMGLPNNNYNNNANSGNSNNPKNNPPNNDMDYKFSDGNNKERDKKRQSHSSTEANKEHDLTPIEHALSQYDGNLEREIIYRPSGIKKVELFYKRIEIDGHVKKFVHREMHYDEKGIVHKCVVLNWNEVEKINEIVGEQNRMPKY